MSINDDFWTYLTGVDMVGSLTTSSATNTLDLGINILPSDQTTIKYYISAMCKSKWDEWTPPEYNFIPTPLILNKNIKIL